MATKEEIVNRAIANDVPTLEAELAKADAEIERLLAALRKIATGTEDEQYPFRAVPAEYLRRWASEALNGS